MDDGHLAGLVTLEDVRKSARERWAQTQLSEIMTPLESLATATPDQDASSAFDVLTQNEYRQLPVVDRDELKGLLRRRDIIRWLRLHAEAGRLR
jgi:CBS domain-containing protein